MREEVEDSVAEDVRRRSSSNKFLALIAPSRVYFASARRRLLTPSLPTHGFWPDWAFGSKGFGDFVSAATAVTLEVEGDVSIAYLFESIGNS